MLTYWKASGHHPDFCKTEKRGCAALGAPSGLRRHGNQPQHYVSSALSDASR